MGHEREVEKPFPERHSQVGFANGSREEVTGLRR
jgi:hypothetical protein